LVPVDKSPLIPGVSVRPFVGLLLIGAFVCVQPSAADPAAAFSLSASDADDDDDDRDEDKKQSSAGTPKKRVSVKLDNAQPAGGDARTVALVETEIPIIEHVIVSGTFDTTPVEYPALPEVEGTRINSGKKTSFVKPEEFPQVANNDYREVMATTPGIIVSEEPSSPIINFGYRGLDSQRSEFTQVLKDGVSIKNEQFGFPETHYTPILDAVERVEFIRGGAALQFGPQPGGAINFVMKMPRQDALFHVVTKNLFSSDGLYQNYTAVDGSIGKFGYFLYYDHRQREGFREANSDYEVNAGSARVVYDITSDSRLILTIDGYDENHGEPGGLRRHKPGVTDPTGSLLYEVDRDATSRFFDHFRLERDYAVLEYQKVFSERTQFDVKGFGGYLSRWSKRQRGGGLGILPSGGAASTDSIQLREDWTEGVEARLRHDYDLLGDISTFTGGVLFYHAFQTRTDERGFTPDAESGQLRNINHGETWNGSIFAENRFHFGRLSIVPGMRLEFIGQSLDEILNFAKRTLPPPDGPVPLATRSDFSFVPLFGIGASYVLIEGKQIISPVPVAGGKGPEGKESTYSGCYGRWSAAA
jgi:Fe(3+) dicitrate transport protein